MFHVLNSVHLEITYDRSYALSLMFTGKANLFGSLELLLLLGFLGERHLYPRIFSVYSTIFPTITMYSFLDLEAGRHPHQ